MAGNSLLYVMQVGRRRCGEGEGKGKWQVIACRMHCRVQKGRCGEGGRKMTR